MSCLNILITGSTGFLGSNLVNYFTHLSGVNVFSTTRKKADASDSVMYVADFTNYNNWEVLLEDIDIVIHCAGLAHGKFNSNDYYDVNTNCTVSLMRNCIKYVVSRFIFISSVSVLGGFKDVAYTINDLPAPENPYGMSKLLAEEQIKVLSKNSSTDFVPFPIFSA